VPVDDLLLQLSNLAVELLEVRQQPLDQPAEWYGPKAADHVQ
jgi:hypothetical protein